MKRASLLRKNFIMEKSECRLDIITCCRLFVVVFVLASHCFVPIEFVDKTISIFPVFLVFFAELLFAYVIYFEVFVCSISSKYS